MRAVCGWEIKLIDRCRYDVGLVSLLEAVQKTGGERKHLFSVTGHEGLLHRGSILSQKQVEPSFTMSCIIPPFPSDPQEASCPSNAGNLLDSALKGE